MHRDARALYHRLLRTLEYRIYPAQYSAAVPVTATAWTLNDEPVPFAEAATQQFVAVEPGAAWGEPWATAWLRLHATVPAEWAGRRVELLVELGFEPGFIGFQAEGLAYTPDGSPIKGLNPETRWVPVATKAKGGEDVDVVIEAAGNPILLRSRDNRLDFSATPLGDKATAGHVPLYTLGQSVIVAVDEEVRALINELEVLSGLAQELPAESGRRWELLVGVDRALDVLDAAGIAEGAADARAALAPLLAAPAEQSAHTLSAIGHAHIDSAWLWPFRETRRKVGRTIANVLQLMDDNPDLVYAMSSAQQYQWLQHDQPELFERLRARVKEGRFIPIGGMWVESDTNMPSGEAIVRQLLQGTNFFEKEFGVPTTIGWLPDSFGYSAALPQLLKLAGIERFITQKISWNSTNRFPHHTFWWEGIDGSRVFTHFPSADMYNSTLSGREVAHAARNFEEKGWSNRSLIPFGYGDGGGGPTREMLARARAQHDLEGAPRVHIESPAAFFDKAEAELPDAAIWFGEMYLEFHRGVLTSQAGTKQGNRRAERLFREAELWSTHAAVRAGADYPYDEFQSLWQTLLLLQFHDVLPGSSIAWVHHEAETEFARVAEALERIVAASIAALGGSTPGAVANASPFERSGVPGHSVAVPVAPSGSVTVQSEAGGYRVGNGVVDLLLGADGTIHELVDVESGRSVLVPGERANLLQIHPDYPTEWDAWDLDERYRRHVEDIDAAIDIVASTDPDGAARFTVRREFGQSTVTQVTVVRAGSATIEFEADVQWQERERILKVGFPTTLAVENWAAETQFGHLFRPTNSNTSWEAAKFEACAHRWVHIGEPNFGIAVVNEHTYGHEVRRTGTGASGSVGTTIRLSLLRGPRYPDPDADLGRHVLHYSLVVGASIEDAVRAGYGIADGSRPANAAVQPLVTSSDSAVVIDTVKLAEDRSGDVIVRLYESLGTRVATTISWDGDWAVREVDILERDVEGTSGEALTFSPFQVRTLRASRR